MPGQANGANSREHRFGNAFVQFWYHGGRESRKGLRFCDSDTGTGLAAGCGHGDKPGFMRPMEFPGLRDHHAYSEADLETAILDHIQAFLLEMGNGFCFEARQKRITLDNEHDRIDLVFYHRVLRCHVLIDLKVRKFLHTDAGQMNFYIDSAART